MAQESLAPVAAITNLILGIITILMSNRSDNQTSHKRFSALLIGWTFILLSIYNFAETLLTNIIHLSPQLRLISASYLSTE
ncbi:MAG: hypothetical protein HOL22_00090 [Euryarchaeota archaeon]|nr:hypothetical protein [Euryarchaeota archaeon]